MELGRHLPLSCARVLKFEEHPPGTIVVLPAWSAKPAQLCLAIKIGGAIVGVPDGEAAVVLCGTPYGDGGNALGQVFQLSELRYATRVPGFQCRARVEVDALSLADQSQQSTLRQVIGHLAVSASGVRLIAGSGEGIRRWAAHVDTNTWTALGGEEVNLPGSAFFPEWRLRLEFEEGYESALDLKVKRDVGR